LNKEEKTRLINKVLEFIDLFAVNPNNPGVQTKTKMHVPLKEETIPIKLPPYRTSPIVQQEIRRQVNQLLEDGLIEKSSSPC